MKIIALALLSTVVFFPPVPRQTPDKGSSSPEKPANTAKAKAHPAAPATSVIQKDCASEKFKNDPDCKEPANKETTITISKLPTANITIESNPKRDCWDWLAYIANVGLTIAGFAGIVFAYRTLKDVERQTEATRDATEVSKKALIASQRPRLEVKHLFLIPDQTITGKPEDGHDWHIGCVLANVGGSKAEIYESNLTVSILGVGTLDGLIPPVPHYDTKYSFRPFTLITGVRVAESVALGANQEGMHMRIAHQAAKSRGFSIYTNPIICYGFFRYRDENGISRLTGFGWLWNSCDLSFTRLNQPNYEYTD